MSSFFRLFLSCCLITHAAGAAASGMPLPEPPPFTGRSFVLMDFHSGQLLAGQAPASRVEPASITKLMTAYIVFSELKGGNLKLGDTTTISEKAWRTGGSRMFVNVGSQVRIEDLLRGMIVQSGNDATIALAEAVAGSEDTFAEMMNQYAQKLGMRNSRFTNSHGLDEDGHYSTAYDIALLSRAVIHDFPEYYRYYSERAYTYNNITQHNRNGLLGRDGVDGIKTGHTDKAGYCLVASAPRGAMRLIAVVTGTESMKAREQAAGALLAYGFRFFETHKLYDPSQPIEQVRVWKGTPEMLPIGVGRPLYVTTPRGHRKNLGVKAQVQKQVMAPVAAGQPLGSIAVELAGETLRQEPLVALQAAPLGGWWRRLSDGLRLKLQN
jgi:serine-type D-Ala-D-Ala carboxypeptidase (penicillin-binding protein 5/6)